VCFIGVCGALSSLTAGECDNWQANHPDWLWCDGFESGVALAANYQDVSTNGMSVATGEAFEGSHSLRQSYTQGQVDAGWICRVNNSGFPDHVFMRWYHKFEAGFEGYPPKMARIRYRQRSGEWTSTFAVHCWEETDGVVALDVHAKYSTQANSSGWLPIARSSFTFSNSANMGRWICFEMEVKVNTSGTTDGLYRLWANDTLIVERTNVDLRGSTGDKINEMMLDCYWNGGSPKAQNRYYDNLVISTQKIGPVHTATVADVPHAGRTFARGPCLTKMVFTARMRGAGLAPKGYDIRGRALTSRHLPTDMIAIISQ
jgi:hypothetical protein